jgi:DNA-binding MarR family transcriptional regulator
MKESPQVSPLEAHIGFWLRLVSSHVSQSFARRLEIERVTVAEWVVLRVLLNLGETAPNVLAESMGMTRGAISKVIDKLVGKDLVIRTSDADDRRYQSLRLTQAGRVLTPRLAQIADENDAEYFGHLDQATRENLIQLLQEVACQQRLKSTPVD